MQINAHLKRIGLAGPLPVTAETLALVHRAQAYAIPYEGLDIQAGVALDLNIERIFDKLVTRGRGGWCYETNGLLGWALGELGFDVMRCTAGVYRREKGDAVLGNHLTLLVNLPGSPAPWLCDLGLGDALRAPLPLIEGEHHDGPFTFRLEHRPDGFWRFHNHSYGAPPTFDFRPVPADETLFQRHNHTLQTDPESYFVLNAEAIRMGADQSTTLLGRVLRHNDATDVRKEILTTPQALTAALHHHFGITGIDTDAIWPKISARHMQLFPDTTP